MVGREVKGSRVVRVWELLGPCIQPPPAKKGSPTDDLQDLLFLPLPFRFARRSQNMPSSSTPVVLVVGASRGIGLAIVQYLLHASPKTTSPTISKSNVITLSRSLPSELKDLQSKHGEQLECVQGDILEEKTHKDVVDKALAKWGRLDGVVSNAGIIEFGRLADAKVSRAAISDEV